MRKGQQQQSLVAVVEGGGTSFVVAVAEVRSRSVPLVLHRLDVDSSHDDPTTTLKECAAFFERYKPTCGYAALGIATFGPVGLDPTRTEFYGRILNTTPKKAWRGVDLLTPLSNACRVGSQFLPVSIETDVNAPAFAEYLLVKNTLSSVAYITVGTGIGVGLVIGGQPVHGRMHPEGGHVPVQPLEGDLFKGYSWGEKSPFKGCRTVESLACSVALTERLEQISGQKNTSRSCLADLGDDHEVWDHAANALANLCVTLILTTSVEKIVMGGGVMNRKGLLEKIQERTVVLLNGYLELPNDMSQLICLSSYGSNAGLTGALVLAQTAFEEDVRKTKKALSPYSSGMIHGIALGAAVALAAILLSKPK